VLVERLPPESAFTTAVRNAIPEDVIRAGGADPAKSAWSNSESLTALVVDELRKLQWMYASAHSENPLPKPEPIARPGVHGRTTPKISYAVAQELDPRLRGLSPEEVQERFDSLTGRTR
jgi:hypothetical protein